MGHVLDYLRAFGTKIDQWIIAPRDEDEWYETMIEEAEFLTNWIETERSSVALGCTVKYPTVTERPNTG